ncbi:FUSC family protein [Streptomyces sp. BE303]|uniref:FUSC family protein n=1 Tax=Streptomyces sp. BE303 TaxID=3002528 RepID=UPI002E78C22C|nr:FUSC family protein [Streptomyces sp. BE303]MED7955491.1 FUSC family protein [Streptomyces sp. BE303]
MSHSSDPGRPALHPGQAPQQIGRSLVTAAPPADAPWWARAARPARPPLPLALMVRAAFGMAVPLAVGLLTHRVDLGVFAGLGAMHATMNDRIEPVRLRAPRIGGAVLASALGMLIGTALQHLQPAALTLGAVLTVTAFVSGALSATGPRGSAAGMLLLVSAALGSGMPLPHPWWAAAPMMLAGAAFVVLLGLPSRSYRRPAADPRNRALAAAYDALGRVLADLGTPQGAASRQVLTARLNQVQDLLPPPRPRLPDSPRTVRLRRMYEAALAATEAAAGLLWAWRPVPAEVAEVPARLARAVERGGGEVPVPDWLPDTPSRRALDVALRAASETVAGREAAPGTAPAPPPDPWRLRVRLLSAASVRYGLRVALCIAVGSAVTASLPLSKSYWVPMTIAFVLKPDLGSVFLRAVSRSVGTVLGVAVTAGLLSLTTDAWALTGIAALCVALLPYATAAHYGLNTVVMTPMALVLLQLGGQSGAAEFWPRLLDTVLASAIVLLFGYLLWPERARHRIEPRLVTAAAALESYLASVAQPDGPQPLAEVWLRRTAYRALADARSEVERGLSEPPPTGRLAAQWLPATAALERLSGAVAAFAAQRRYGGRVPDPVEVARVRRALDDLTAAARAHRPPTRAAVRPTRPHDPTRSALGRAADELDTLLGNGRPDGGR